MSAGTAIDATLDRRVGPSPGLRARVRAVPPGRPFLTPTVDALFDCGGFSLPLLFVAGSVARLDLGAFVRPALRFMLLGHLPVVLLVTYVPELSLALPDLLVEHR